MVIVIALIGADGTGKTTLAKKALAFFRKFGISAFYKHLYGYFIVGPVIRFVKRIRLGSAKRKTQFDSMQRHHYKEWQYQLWYFLLWFDNLIFYFFYSLFKPRSILIFDRYLYDVLDGSGVSTRILRWLFLHFVPPDISIVLVADPRTLRSRKMEEYGKKTVNIKEYIHLANLLRIPILDTTGSIDQTMRRVLQIIFKHNQLRIRFIKSCELNRVLFRALQTERLYEIHEDFRCILSFLNRRYVAYKRLIVTIDETFKRHEIPWAMKDYSIERAPEYDLDIMVRTQDYSKARSYVRSMNSSMSIHIREGLESYLTKTSSVGDTKVETLSKKFVLQNIIKNKFVRLSDILYFNSQKNLSNDNDDPVERYVYGLLCGRKAISYPHFIPFSVILKSGRHSNSSFFFIVRSVFSLLINRLLYMFFMEIYYHPTHFSRSIALKQLRWAKVHLRI